MTDEQRGLYDKYRVINNETGEHVDNCLVLRPDRDKAAWLATMYYVMLVKDQNAPFARGLMEWMASMLGDQS